LRCANGSFKGTFEQLLAHEKLGPLVLDDGLYVQRIKEWRKALGEENFLVVFLDDVANEPQGTYSRICKYLSISDEHIPRNLHEKINQPERVRSRILRDIHLKAALFLSRNEFRILKNIIKTSQLPRIIYDINHAKSRMEYMTRKDFDILQKFYSTEIEELENLFNRNLSHWHTSVETL